VKFTLDQREALDEILTRHRGEAFSVEVVKDEFCLYLRGEAEAGNLDNLIDELGASAVQQAVHARTWRLDSAQDVLFDADALLALGDNEYIRMEDVRAEHAVRHLQVLNENHRRQTEAFHKKNGYLTDRIPQLYARGCSLGELEAAA
jgi:hypothetical protein